MKRETITVFHALMKKGWIDRTEDNIIWSYYDNTEVQEELEDFKSVMGIDLYRHGNRLYMIPTQENDLFLKNNVDFRRDIKADNSVRTKDLYLMNYLSIYMLYVFFNGRGQSPESRDFISKDEFVRKFTEHCLGVEVRPLESSNTQQDYSENFIQLAGEWLSKVDGDPSSIKFNTKYGVVNRILNKYKIDDLFDVRDDDTIRPTQKLKDLMPYFLRKDRINEIQGWLRKEEQNATIE